jgi:hypothetical protein
MWERCTTLPRQKPPVIDDYVPEPNEVYDLDDYNQLRLANLNFDEHLKIADEYDHYPHCKWALIEYKSKSLRDSVEQLEWTAKQLSDMERDVDHAIIIAEGIDNPERNLYSKRGNLLIYKPKKKPVTISTGRRRIDVEIFDPHEIDRQYKKYRGTLRSWGFK